jgi:hypothetical protein
MKYLSGTHASDFVICLQVGQMQNLCHGWQLSNCNSLSSSNSLTNHVLNKKLII